MFSVTECRTSRTKVLLLCVVVTACAGCTSQAPSEPKSGQALAETRTEPSVGGPAEMPPEPHVAGPQAARDRRVFAKSMSDVMKGMPQKEVRRLLGKPDDVRTQNDPGGITTFRTKEIWCYGTNGHLTFPTLGCVYIDTESKAQYVFGGGADTPDPALLSEEKLAGLLRLIDRAPQLAGYQYDPLPIIHIVNALQPLGKDKALAVIDEYLRVAS